MTKAIRERYTTALQDLNAACLKAEGILNDLFGDDKNEEFSEQTKDFLSYIESLIDEVEALTATTEDGITMSKAESDPPDEEEE